MPTTAATIAFSALAPPVKKRSCYVVAVPRMIPVILQRLRHRPPLDPRNLPKFPVRLDQSLHSANECLQPQVYLVLQGSTHTVGVDTVRNKPPIRRNRPLPVGPKRSAMGPSDVLCLDPVQLPHPFGKVRIRRFEHHVIMVRHQTIGMTNPVETTAGCTEDLQKRRSVALAILKKDRLPFVARCGNVIQSARELET